MADKIQDLDDVEAQAWAFVWAALAASGDEVPSVNADECVRLLRERRTPSALREDPQIAEWAVDIERQKIVAWLRAEQARGRVAFPADLALDIERGEHDR